MAERNDVKLRTCSVCKGQIESTAKGIKDHAAKCGKSRVTITKIEE